ncbi:MAG: glutaredoxin 3 [Myxococcota bacterium]|nr:glutaredoxin 3 [Myxococcota bacterium]
MPKVRMFKAIPCPYCSAAYRFLTEVKGVEVEEIDLTGDRKARIELMQRTGQRTVPQIFVGDVHVGGYDQMRALDRQGGLDPLLFN